MSKRILLDVTRLFSRRFHSAHTGVDRVEFGVYQALSENPENRFLLRFGPITGSTLVVPQ